MLCDMKNSAQLNKLNLLQNSSPKTLIPFINHSPSALISGKGFAINSKFITNHKPKHLIGTKFKLRHKHLLFFIKYKLNPNLWPSAMREMRQRLINFYYVRFTILQRNLNCFYRWYMAHYEVAAVEIPPSLSSSAIAK